MKRIALLSFIIGLLGVPIQAQAAMNCVTFPQKPNPEAELRYLLSHPGARVCPSPHPNLAGQTRSLNSFNNWMTNWTINQMH